MIYDPRVPPDWDADHDFPLGDGTAETDAMVICPHCGQATSIGLDPGSGGVQDYVEDCPVCCRAWRVRVRYAADGAAEVDVTAED